jgi:ribosomal-protein-alanine N-acetyltransferase
MREAEEAPILRRARIFDISKMHAIEKASFPTPWSFDALFGDAFLNGNTFYTVVEYNRDVAAYGGMWLVLDEAHITNIAVKPEYRRLGFADQLLSYMEDLAYKNGAVAMLLEVRQSNLPAYTLYEKHGFYKIGTRPRYYKNPVEDAYIMRKDLP